MDAAIKSLRQVASLIWNAPSRALKAISEPKPVYPLGYWLCTHAAEWAQDNGFVPGQTYLCDYQPGTSCMRIYPSRTSDWAPYWDQNTQSFCYDAEDMVFEYLGRAPDQSSR